MISTILVEISRWVPLLFWAGCAAVAATAWILHRLRLRVALFVLSGLALLAVAGLTLLPDGEPSDGGCTVQFSVPLQGIDTLANVAMMLPLALFLGVATRRPVLVIGAVSALSAAVETVQALVPALGRRCDTDDWLMNTVGAAVGGLAALAILWVERRRSCRGESVSAAHV
ncbi:glycopeptide antibiotics resistance protein [Microbacterium testaceum StLB037]|uniref:Glycopeptide antibiotics resistance protein n=1 Tax=Microbacterium testaceum (strain StLB037) TaxID=979556 RepID=E8N7G8_MICTS|nr:VanZ family protein [Microbacterium testaceum]BAJ73001.1 glycopeptide antibiotics resistance protein [Microbacterium testaceum StLB037]